ncbi:germinal-center associated nuclear protein [Xenopus laevis]|uniref:Germinal-center associated nuclear protein n=2 Tax=Xenopus laevis TaxID=8355 RepID=A0A1L8EWK2_XENLA|nr:germinal-center associated nuclear protein [Xenopus laevis]XP_041432378.1 germinal-center associated nuclear protein [Xenopus laevis]OCT63703.1 hypothetical protein XELAEV_18044803mg [Xenopus laevis]
MEYSMNPNNPFGGQNPSGSLGQNQGSSLFGQPSVFGQTSTASPVPMFGQTSAGYSAPLFGQTSANHSAPVFGQTSSTHSTPVFGQVSTGQSATLFGQNSTGQMASLFGQTSTSQSASVFGQVSTSQSAPLFGQVSTTQSAPLFGQSNTSQMGSMFGQASSKQSGPLFGQNSSAQLTPAFGQVSSSQSTSIFGQASTGQTTSMFDQSSGQPPSIFGQASPGQSPPMFGQNASGQSSVFGQSPSGQPTPAFGNTITKQSNPAFGLSTSSQSVSAFGQVKNTPSAPAFGQTSGSQSANLFGQVSTCQSVPIFGQTTTSQSASVFGQTTTGQNATAPSLTSNATFGTGMSVFGQGTVGSTVPLLSQSGNGQGSAFGQGNSGQGFQFGQISAPTSSGFGQTTTSQSNLISQTSGPHTAFSTAPEQQSGSSFTQGAVAFEQSLFRKGTSGSEQLSVFGQNSGASEKTSVTLEKSGSGSVFGQVNLGTDSSGTKILSNLGQMSKESSRSNFNPPSNSTFKPIFGAVPGTESQVTTSSMNQMSSPIQPIGHSGSRVSAETQNSTTFSFASADSKDKDETSRPVCGSVSSNFSNFVSPTTSSDPLHVGEMSKKEDSPKGIKRKEEIGRSSVKPPSSDENFPSSRSDHPPEKKPSRLGRQLTGGANMYVRSLYDVVRSHMKTQHKKEPPREIEEATHHQEPQTESPSASYPLESQSVSIKTASTVGSSQSFSGKVPLLAGINQQMPKRNYMQPGQSQSLVSRAHLTAGVSPQNLEKSNSPSVQSQLALTRPQPLPDSEEHSSDNLAVPAKTPLRRTCRADSGSRTDRAMRSPNDATSIHVTNLPNHLNQKQHLEKFFKKAGKVQRVYCKLARKMAIIHFHNHMGAANAKKMAKKLHSDVCIFFQKKKTSPGKKGEFLSKSEQQTKERAERLSDEESTMPSPLRKRLVRDITAGAKLSPQQKPGFSKALQFDIESSDVQKPPSDSSGVALPPSLSHLLGVVAESSDDKYELLNQRDKILRQARVKRTELDQAKVFVGTCPDMCPEKERYMRETRNQLSIFEVLPGTDKVDHSSAIKEYSRSSADQEEPLPHELRPTCVLTMTMDYLVTQIMDKGEGNYREWYDFVWNRTRGIRKDITQQHLCNLSSVSLMEKCMRFHIHCAFELCEEPMSSFDANINIENLTKCLLSLKEMYQDLHNRGISCPCEPEFRGYSVLLNLNKGDILREVQEFHPTVRNSEEVKFALQVFAALNSTNFVRFFKLMQSAAYLNSCILHRYFNQIRREALRVLNVAYTPSIQRPTLFPLESMLQLLVFQDSNEATEFLTSYGLSVSDGNVELSRSAFFEPEVPPHPKKSFFIRRKRQVSVGEIVNGGPLPRFSLHNPVSSFDGLNKYTGGGSLVEPGLGGTQETPGSAMFGIEKPERQSEPEEQTNRRPFGLHPENIEPIPVVPISVLQPILLPKPPPSPPKQVFTHEGIDVVAQDIIDEILKEQSFELIQDATAYISAARGETVPIADVLLTDVISEISHRVAVEEMSAEKQRVKEEKRKKAEEARLKHERERLLDQISLSQCKDLLKEVLTDNIYNISNEELRYAVQLDRNACITRCSEKVCDEYLYQFLELEIFELAKDSLREMQYYSKYLQRWREVLAVRKKLRRQMRGFPAAPGSVSRDEKLKALFPSAALRGAPPSFTSFHQSREQIFHQMKVQHFFQKLLCDAAWTPLELPSLIAQNLNSWKDCIFWKLVLLLPETSETPDSSTILSEWLKAKFSWTESQTPDTQQQSVDTLVLNSSLEFQDGRPVRVNMCVKVAQGPLTDTEMEQAETKKDLLGTSGLILLLPPLDDNTEDDVYLLSALVQLKQLLQAKPFQPPIPLAVLVPSVGMNAMSKVYEGLNLSDLVSNGLISEYQIFSLTGSLDDLQGTEQVINAVQFLLSNCPRTLELCSLPLRQFIEDGVCSGFSEPFHRDVWERKKAGLPPQDPAAIIDLYNCVLAFLANVVSSEQLSDISWPVTEFSCPDGNAVLPHVCWNHPGHLAWLKKSVLSFQMPQMDKPPPGAPWVPVCSMILEYINQICRCKQGLPVLLSEVQMLLRHAYEKLHTSEGDRYEEEFPAEEFPWDDLLNLCINHKLRDWDPPVNPEYTGSPEDIRVYFLQDDLRNLSPSDLWERARMSTHTDVQETNDSATYRQCLPTQRTKTLTSIYVNPEETLDKEELGSEFEHINKLRLQLKQSLEAEREESKGCKEKLQNFLEEEALESCASPLLPMYLPEALLRPQGTSTNLSHSGAHSSPLKMSLDTALYIPSPQRAVERDVSSTTLQRALYKSPQLRLSENIIRTPSQESSLMENISTASLRPTLTDKLNELRRLINANRQENSALELHLNTLLDVGKP